MFSFLNLTTRNGIAIHRFTFSFSFPYVSLYTVICSNLGEGGFVCIVFVFSKKKSFFFRKKLLRFRVKGRKKYIVKLAARIRDWFFVRFFCFALTQRICDCVGFFTLSYRKMLTFFCCLLFGLRVLCVCVMKCVFCNYFQKKRTFSVQVMMMFPSFETKLLCFKKVLC